MKTDTLPFISRDALKALAEASTSGARVIELVDAPGLGMEVGVLKLRSRELDDLYAWVRKDNKRRKRLGDKSTLGFRAFILARTLVLKDGTRLLSDDDATSGWLDDLPADLTSALVKTAFRLNGIGKEEEREDEEDEDAAAEAAPEPSPGAATAPASEQTA